eukprot:TRINITY_DN6760_c0_g1_i1.p1 TRINITY_DN6760_c0_g1~~TRINITY_DN6760_c0_g1_i1.p1  ORF type:complete len:445 (-),score=86.20 TRINITY_DN6760_c0_g1_i1:273-1544(-)
MFRQFLKQKFCDEILDFYITVELFKKVIPQFQPTECEYIIDLYVKEGSPRSVNLSYESLGRIDECHRKGFYESIFDDAQRECYHLMVLDCVNQFHMSGLYDDYIQTIDQKRKKGRELKDLMEYYYGEQKILVEIPRESDLLYEVFIYDSFSFGNVQDFEEVKEKLQNIDQEKEIFSLNNIDIGYWKDSFIFKSVQWSLRITSLSLMGCNLTELPDIRNMKGLSILNISQNHLPKIPKYLVELTQLESLQLGSNELYAIPSLIVNENNIQYVSDEIGKLNKLSLLDLSSNDLRELPNDMRKMESLSILLLDNNNLWKLYDSISSNSKLKTISFLGNRCTIELPFSIIWLQNLYIDFSPLQVFGIPRSICTDGGNLVMVYATFLGQMGITRFDLKYHWSSNVENGCWQCKERFTSQNKMVNLYFS